jgi:hypothetical protein
MIDKIFFYKKKIMNDMKHCRILSKEEYAINRVYRIAIRNGLEEVEDPSTLCSLNLSEYDIVEDDFKAIRDYYTNVEILFLDECDLEQFPDIVLPQIKTLCMWNNCKLKSIANFPIIFPNLEYLDLTGSLNLRQLMTTHRFESLKVFIAYGTRVHISPNDRFESLLYLDIGGGCRDDNVDYDVSFPKLVFLKFEETHPSGINWNTHTLTENEKQVIIDCFQTNDVLNDFLDDFHEFDFTRAIMDVKTLRVNNLNTTDMMKIISRGFFPNLVDIQIEKNTE